jgi:hypothetical protein
MNPRTRSDLTGVDGMIHLDGLGFPGQRARDLEW